MSISEQLKTLAKGINPDTGELLQIIHVQIDQKQLGYYSHSQMNLVIMGLKSQQKVKRK